MISHGSTAGTPVGVPRRRIATAEQTTPPPNGVDHGNDKISGVGTSPMTLLTSQYMPLAPWSPTAASQASSTNTVLEPGGVPVIWTLKPTLPVVAGAIADSS